MKGGMFEAGRATLWRRGLGELNLGHGAIASRHMVTISGVLRVQTDRQWWGLRKKREKGRGTAFGRAVDIT